MTRDTLNAPTARTWRDIPQPVVPRAMSREGRWRLAMATMRITAAVAIVGVIGWGIWLVAGSLRENPHAMPAAAKAIPIKPPELRTDGVLTNEWLARTLALPRTASLMELDLQTLQSRLLGQNQVLAATLTKNFPDRLIVQISERSPVARLMVRWLGEQKMLLVARDGVVYVGEGYDRSVLDTLPWLDGVKLEPKGGGFLPIAGMATVAELLGKARLEAEHLYSSWHTVSLARLETDHQLEIRTKGGLWTIYFTTNDDYFRQLAKLDYITDSLSARPDGTRATIDLTFGQNVPVTLAPPEPAPGVRQAVAVKAAKHPDSLVWRAASEPAPAPASQAFFILPPSQPRNNQREL